MGSSAKSISGIGIEQSQSGLYQLLAPTLVSAFPASISPAIPAGQNMRLLFVISNHTATGMVSVTGKSGLAANAANETSYTLPTAEVPGDPITYVTSQVFNSIDASGLTLTGLTGGTISVFGIQAATHLVPGEFKFNDKSKEHSPNLQRGSFDEQWHLLTLGNEPDWEYSGELYPDVNLWAVLGGYNSAPTITTIPAAPVAVLASTPAATSGNASAAIQPTAPGMVLQIVLGGTAPASAGTVSVTGTNIYGETVTEVVVPSSKTQGTYTSLNVFTAIAANGIVWTAFGTGATITVNGVFGFAVSGSPGDTLASLCLENYDSTASFAGAYGLIDEWDVEGGMDKEAKITAKGPLQGLFPVGNPATTTNQVTSFAQPLDFPVVGWQTLISIDPLGGTPGATQNQDLIDYKVSAKLNQVFKRTSWNQVLNRYANRAYRKKRTITVEVTLDMTAASYQAEYKAFKQRRTRLIQLRMIGPYMGTDSGTPYYLGFTLILPVKWLDVPERDFSSGKESVELKLKGTAYFEPVLGYSHKLTWFTRYPTW